MSKPRNAEIEFKALEPAYDKTSDTFIAFEAAVDGDIYQVSLGEFPDESRYTLLVNGERTESFDDWPNSWRVRA